MGYAPDATPDVARSFIGTAVDIDRLEITFDLAEEVSFESRDVGLVRGDFDHFVTEDGGLSFRRASSSSAKPPVGPRDGLFIDDHGEGWPTLQLPEGIGPHAAGPGGEVEKIERLSKQAAWVEIVDHDALHNSEWFTLRTLDGGQTWLRWPASLDLDDGPLFLGKLAFRGGTQAVVSNRAISSIEDAVDAPTFPIGRTATVWGAGGKHISAWGEGVVAQVDSRGRLSFFENDKRVRSTRIRLAGGARREAIVGVDT